VIFVVYMCVIYYTSVTNLVHDVLNISCCNFLCFRWKRSLYVLMARILVLTASRGCVCPNAYGFTPLAFCGHWLNAFAGIPLKAKAVFRASYMLSSHLLSSARRNYKIIRKLSHLTVEEQFVLRVSSNCLCDYLTLILYHFFTIYFLVFSLGGSAI